MTNYPTLEEAHAHPNVAHIVGAKRGWDAYTADELDTLPSHAVVYTAELSPLVDDPEGRN